MITIETYLNIYIYESYFGIETYSRSFIFQKRKEMVGKVSQSPSVPGPASRPCGRHWPPSPSPLAGPRCLDGEIIELGWFSIATWVYWRVTIPNLPGLWWIRMMDLQIRGIRQICLEQWWGRPVNGTGYPYLRHTYLCVHCYIHYHLSTSYSLCVYIHVVYL